MGLLALLMVLSCDYKKTHVINTIHTDGSITRKVKVETNNRDYLEFNKIAVPMDSTWQIDIQMETKISEEDKEVTDTIWYLTAEKHFASVDEINQAYQNDAGANKGLKRSATFNKRFRWFSTVYRYREKVDKVLTIDCPLSDFLTEEELTFTKLPDPVQDSLKAGPDSLMYKDIKDKTETWMMVSEIRQMIEVFYDHFGTDPRLTRSKEDMLSRDMHIVNTMQNDTVDNENGTENHQDSLMRVAFGETFYTEFKTEIDSSLNMVEVMDKPFWNATSYNLEIQMPGKIIESNGYAETDNKVDGEKGILWTVSGMHYLTEDYEMWAESRVNNYGLWMLTAAFILFVFIGLLRFKMKK